MLRILEVDLKELWFMLREGFYWFIMYKIIKEKVRIICDGIWLEFKIQFNLKLQEEII